MYCPVGHIRLNLFHMNKSQFIGHLAADAEVIQGVNGEFVKFRLGVSERYKNRAGELIDSTEWINCTMSKNAVLPYLVKGKEVLVEGRIRAEAYQKKDSTEPGASLSLRVSELRLLGGKTGSEAPDNPSVTVETMTTPVSKGAPVNYYQVPEEEGDLPF